MTAAYRPLLDDIGLTYPRYLVMLCLDAVHQVCPYSNATRDNIEVTILLG